MGIDTESESGSVPTIAIPPEMAEKPETEIPSSISIRFSNRAFLETDNPNPTDVAKPDPIIKEADKTMSESATNVPPRERVFEIPHLPVKSDSPEIRRLPAFEIPVTTDKVEEPMMGPTMLAGPRSTVERSTLNRSTESQ
jgi:hypothetical protein